jgi:hypothetical protein
VKPQGNLHELTLEGRPFHRNEQKSQFARVDLPFNAARPVSIPLAEVVNCALEAFIPCGLRDIAAINCGGLR